MAETDILGKALSMAADAGKDGASRRRAFGEALLRALSGAGDFHTPLAVPAYPQDAQRRDLEAVGRAMYGALEEYAETQAPPQQG